MSGFSSLNMGTRALFAAQRALDTTGQNISNVNTEGYSRQRVQQTAAGASSTPAMFSRSDGAGDGVDVRSIQRIRDDFLETRAQSEHAAQSSLATSQQIFADIETTFGEPSSSGLQSQMSSFWGSWHDVANDPGSLAPRSQLLERANALAGSFNGLTGRLSQQWSDVREQLSAAVTDVNAMATNVAQLNRSIRSALVSGAPANDLSDQRDLLVLKLGSAIGATATPGEDGIVNLAINGTPLVSGDQARALQVGGPLTYPGSAKAASISWAEDGYPVSPSGGTTQAMLAAVNTTIPAYLSSLAGIASSMATAVNSQQAQGYTLKATPPTPPATAVPDGQPMFLMGAGGKLSVTTADPRDIAASKAGPPALDGDNGIAMAAHSLDATGPDATYRTLMVDLGVQSQSIQRQSTVQTAITNQVDNARQGVSGVSMDEEMTNLVQYQHAYEAAARFVSTISSTLDTLMQMTR
ncbi:MAG: flgK [Frankiales bacterium]|jgi:flagellar hook-associated protein 1 FlgK|nr:flgK [Frankiales bacterium]